MRRHERYAMPSIGAEVPVRDALEGTTETIASLYLEASQHVEEYNDRALASAEICAALAR